MKFLSIIIVTIAIVLFFQFGWAGSIVTIEGKAAIVQNDQEATKQKGLENALSKAVEAYVENSISKAGVGANYEKLNSAVFGVYKDFVNQYEVVEERSDAEWYYVKTKVDINDKKLNGQLIALGLTPGSGGKPKVVVMVSEQNVDKVWSYSFYGGLISSTEVDLNVCEGTISNALISEEFQVVADFDPSTREKAVSYKNIYNKYDEALDAVPNVNATQLAKALDSEVGLVIACKAVATNQGKKSAQFYTVTANATCKIVNTKNNLSIGSARGKGSQPHIDPISGGTEALAKACEDAADQLKTLLSKFYK